MGRRKKEGSRVLGPYDHDGGYRVILVHADGRRRPYFFTEHDAAERYAKTQREKVASVVHTTETALNSWLKELGDKKLSPRTIEGYEWAVRKFWPETKALSALKPSACAARYRQLIGEMSVDSHRNCLKMCRTFVKWCIDQGWLASDPLEKVQGVGKRKRGKPQLRRDETRKLFAVLVPLAEAGDEGAIAALMCLLLSLRSEKEALAVVARDLDDDGQLLWVDDSKTDAGRRVIEVPDVLQGPLKRLAQGKAREAHLFRRRDRKWLWDACVRLCKKAEVPQVSPQALRGMHATLARQAGATSRMVADTLGHAGTSITERAYIDQGQAQAADRERGLKLVKGGRS